MPVCPPANPLPPSTMTHAPPTMTPTLERSIAEWSPIAVCLAQQRPVHSKYGFSDITVVNSLPPKIRPKRDDFDSITMCSLVFLRTVAVWVWVCRPKADGAAQRARVRGIGSSALQLGTPTGPSAGRGQLALSAGQSRRSAEHPSGPEHDAVGQDVRGLHGRGRHVRRGLSGAGHARQVGPCAAPRAPARQPPPPPAAAPPPAALRGARHARRVCPPQSTARAPCTISCAHPCARRAGAGAAARA